MDINYEAQDENGTTALMEAAYCPTFNSLLEKLLKYHVDINKTDNNGNTVLFYASRNFENLKKIIKTGIDINHVNKDDETVLSYCAKMNRVRSFEYLKNVKSIDPNHFNCIGRTAAMHLVENAQSVLLKSFINDKNIDPNYKNKFEETLVTTFVKSYYQHYIGNFKDGSKMDTRYTYEKTKRFGETLKTLIGFNCDFNVPVDDDGNTPIMVFLLMKDYVTCQYLLSQDKISIDLSKENYHGVNASYLSLLISSEVFDGLTYKDSYNDKLSYSALKKAFIKNETFDKKYLDVGDEDIKVVDSKKIINNYPVTSVYKTIQTWLIEIYFPGAVSEISLVAHTTDDPTSFGSNLTMLNTQGLM
ncbi:ankyrin [Anaeromyces robustus]|uniref:Ankyrin n=1 Tax=Anaeromyces robustus TaxID=1754192 RepID=A0A1Y1X2E3_9FUNG|nr:ankyrin [Anaeromyces robustus]|eukprot:ORX79969.1 ankyrin [Anaeromyces robustus]